MDDRGVNFRNQMLCECSECGCDWNYDSMPGINYTACSVLGATSIRDVSRARKPLGRKGLCLT